MSIISTLRRGPVLSRAIAERDHIAAQVELLQESIADLELAADDAGWQKLSLEAETSFSRAGLTTITNNCRVFAVANPLVKRGLAVRQSYVFGQGVELRARADGKKDGQQDVNAVVQEWWTDDTNRAAVFGPIAAETLERSLGTDGNVFIANFTNPRTGRVLSRTIPFDQIQDIIFNPEDGSEPWFYKRVWTVRELGALGQISDVNRVEYYPALRYYPRVRPRVLGKENHPINWDAPVYHIKVNALAGWAFGIGDAYAALAWARAYRDFLADWATLVKSLSQFAWKVSTGGKSKSQKMREALARRPTSTAPAGNPNHVGATVTTDADVTLEAIPKTGATVDSHSGQPLAAMVAAALEIPVTTLMSDPGQTGARAVAETLDQPTRLAMQQRQTVWTEAYRALAEYVIRQAVKAPSGPLRGSVIRDPFTQREFTVLLGDTDANDDTIEVVWPDLTDVSMETLVKAIVEADGTGKIPPLETIKLLLGALGVREIEDILEEVTDDEGNWIDPAVSAGGVAAGAFRRGEDAAAALRAPEPPEES